MDVTKNEYAVVKATYGRVGGLGWRGENLSGEKKRPQHAPEGANS